MHGQKNIRHQFARLLNEYDPKNKKTCFTYMYNKITLTHRHIKAMWR